MPVNESLSGLKTTLGAFWQRLAERERWAVAVAGGLIAFALVWSIGIAPAIKTLHEAPQAMHELDTQLEQMRTLALEADRLRQMPSVSPAQADAALHAATARLGDQVTLTMQGERAAVAMANVPGWALSSWLTEVREGAHARPESAQLNKVTETTYSGTVVLIMSRQGNE